MHIPKKDIVKFVIKSVIKKQKINSQSELAKILKEELKKADKSYTISAKRARKIALESEVKVKIKTKVGKIPDNCPCCNSKLEKVYTRNLAGKKILLKLICKKCEYKGLNGKWIPRKYEFGLT